jgi:hypothetical protein
MAGSIGGRPTALRWESQVQWRKPARCQWITVSGFTNTRMSDQRDHRRRRAIQNQRSAGDPRTAPIVGERGELLPKGDFLQNQSGAAAEGRSESAEEQQDEADHGRRRVGEAGRNVNDRTKYELWRATTRRAAPNVTEERDCHRGRVHFLVRKQEPSVEPTSAFGQ